MANDLNQCNFIGRLGKDVETRYTPAGKEVCTFSIACGRKYGGQEETTWVNVVAWEKLAEICRQYLKKGSRVFISARMTTRSYEDRDGNRKYVTEYIANQLQMLDSKPEENQQHGPSRAERNAQSQALPVLPEDDPIPF